ncbi:hypothetical protein CKO_01108 [Citrobacter koseri ATCC BAA-895]|uniref:Uncharacterized protein n=1 Tax=Citrobacter koseri (strain ATCC BAA-895 / CDC 4225-83 / SGSC4696) TaxID=290338 RepID=A8AFI8_CITK8|nr:hypothetical protein CKO_01108 [Citrobacter koseri ATCC BAA-895]
MLIWRRLKKSCRSCASINKYAYGAGTRCVPAFLFCVAHSAPLHYQQIYFSWHQTLEKHGNEKK